MQSEPFVPQRITVHLGEPNEDAQNVTVSFLQYIKNVASCELFPTWPENSIRANIYAIVSFALNRISTNWYKGKGYAFDITNSPKYDQLYMKGHAIFDVFCTVADEIFNCYIRRKGHIEPYFSAFCNGTTCTEPGLSQKGSVDLSNQGYDPYSILTYYYGNDIEIARSKTHAPTYPNIIMMTGMSGNSVKAIQILLNRISLNYPEIPKIYPLDGIFNTETENAVKKFQEIFDMKVTGIVDEATWYRILYKYMDIKRIAQLFLTDKSIEDLKTFFISDLKPGIQGNIVEMLQYYLSVIGVYYDTILPVDIMGTFDYLTEDSVKSFQKTFGLPETGVVDKSTWEKIYDKYHSLIKSSIIQKNYIVPFNGKALKEGSANGDVQRLQKYLSFINHIYPQVTAVNDTGYFGPMTKNSVIAFQKLFGLTPNGTVNELTWYEIANAYADIKHGFMKNPFQYPGYMIGREA